MSITYVTRGSILDDDADILVCPVNAIPGVMGAGLARAFRDRWPGLAEAHRMACRVGHLRAGGGHAVWLTRVPGRDLLGVYLLATKDHWRGPSKLEWVESGLDRLVRDLGLMADPGYDRRVGSVACPALGTGLGGLRWGDVGPLIERAAEKVDGVEWRIYPPS